MVAYNRMRQYLKRKGRLILPSSLTNSHNSTDSDIRSPSYDDATLDVNISGDDATDAAVSALAGVIDTNMFSAYPLLASPRRSRYARPAQLQRSRGSRDLTGSNENSYSTRTTTSLTAMVNTMGRTGNTGRRTRLQRGWWPVEEEEKRGEMMFKAMKDLKDETFVVTEDHLEWIFDQDTEGLRDEKEDPKPEDSPSSILQNNNNHTFPDISEPQCHLILPQDEINSSINSTKQANKKCATNAECAICMLPYDVGHVVVYSKQCTHAFHQDCILDWFSREKRDCPSCRAVFWDPDNNKCKKKDREGRNERRNGTRISIDAPASEFGIIDLSSDSNDDDDDEVIVRCPRGDTEDTDALSAVGEGQRSSNLSFEGDLEPVVEAS